MVGHNPLYANSSFKLKEYIIQEERTQHFLVIGIIQTVSIFTGKQQQWCLQQQ